MLVVAGAWAFLIALIILMVAIWLAVGYYLRREAQPLVFVSYRRNDTEEVAFHISQELATRFGPRKVFLDTQTIKPGQDYPPVLRGALAICDVIVAVVGKQWAGESRLHQQNDWVRVEVEQGLIENKLVVVCVEGATVPEDRPATLARMPLKQAVKIDRMGEGFIRGIEELVSTIRRVRKGMGVRVTWGWYALAAGIVLLAVGGIICAVATSDTTKRLEAIDDVLSKKLTLILPESFEAYQAKVNNRRQTGSSLDVDAGLIVVWHLACHEAPENRPDGWRGRFKARSAALDYNTFGVYAKFDHEKAIDERFSGMKKDQKIRIVGKVVDVTHNTVTLYGIQISQDE